MSRCLAELWAGGGCSAVRNNQYGQTIRRPITCHYQKLDMVQLKTANDSPHLDISPVPQIHYRDHIINSCTSDFLL